MRPTRSSADNVTHLGNFLAAFRSVYAFASLKLRRTRFALTVCASLRHA
jgi:hypothetical protein